MITPDVAMLGQDLFDKLGREKEEQEIRIFQQKKGGLSALVSGFEAFLPAVKKDKRIISGRMRQSSWFYSAEALNSLYRLSKRYIQKKCNKLEILTFCKIFLPLYQEDENFYVAAGMFLSSLINFASDMRIHIPTYRLGKNPVDRPHISFLGYRNNGKEIIVDGDVGDWVGTCMERGTLIINGDARYNAGWRMRGGRIHIKRNAFMNIGECMCGGEIYVEGIATGPGRIGEQMKSGRIIIEKGVIHDYPTIPLNSITGLNMEGGLIEVYGNVNGRVGQGMKGGEIFVCGDVSGSIGSSMNGGSIKVLGSARYDLVGKKMKKGVIEIGSAFEESDYRDKYLQQPATMEDGKWI